MNNILIIFWDGQEPCTDIILENPNTHPVQEIATRLDEVFANWRAQNVEKLGIHPSVENFLQTARQPSGHVWNIKKPATVTFTVDEFLSKMEAVS